MLVMGLTVLILIGTKRWGGWCVRRKVLADGWSNRSNMGNGVGDGGAENGVSYDGGDDVGDNNVVGDGVDDRSRRSVIVASGSTKSAENLRGSARRSCAFISRDKTLLSMLRNLQMKGRFVVGSTGRFGMAENSSISSIVLPTSVNTSAISLRPVIDPDRKFNRRKQPRADIIPTLGGSWEIKMNDHSDGVGVGSTFKNQVLQMDLEFSDDEKSDGNGDDMDELIHSIGRDIDNTANVDGGVRDDDFVTVGNSANVDGILTNAGGISNAESAAVPDFWTVGTSSSDNNSEMANNLVTVHNSVITNNHLHDIIITPQPAATDKPITEQPIAEQPLIEYKKAKAKTKHILANKQHKNRNRKSPKKKELKKSKEKSKFYLMDLFDFSVREIEDMRWVVGKAENGGLFRQNATKSTNNSDKQPLSIYNEENAQDADTIFQDGNDEQLPSTQANIIHSSPSLETNQMQLEDKNQQSSEPLENDTQKSAESEQYSQSVQNDSLQLIENNQQSVQLLKEDTPPSVQDEESEENNTNQTQSQIEVPMQLERINLQNSRAKIRRFLQENAKKDVFKDPNFFFLNQSFDTVSPVSKTDSCSSMNKSPRSQKEIVCGSGSARSALYLEEQYSHILNEHFINNFFYQKDRNSIFNNINSLVKILERNTTEIEETLIMLELTEKKEKKVHTNWSAINHNILCSLCADNKMITHLSSFNKKNLDNYIDNIKFMNYSTLRQYFESNRLDTFFPEYITLFKNFKSFKVLFSSEFRNFYKEIFQLITCQQDKKIFGKSHGPKVILDLFHEQLHIFLETQFHSKILIFPEFHSLIFQMSKKNVIHKELNNQTSLIIYFIFLSINLFFDSVCYNHPIDDLLTGDVDEMEQRFLLGTISFTLRTLFIFPLLSYLDMSKTSVARYHFLTFHIYKTEIDHYRGIEDHTISLSFKNRNMSIILAYNYQITTNYFLNFIRYVHVLQGIRKNILCSNREIKNFKTFLTCLRIQNHPIMQSHQIKKGELKIFDFISCLSRE